MIANVESVIKEILLSKRLMEVGVNLDGRSNLGKALEGCRERYGRGRLAQESAGGELGPLQEEGEVSARALRQEGARWEKEKCEMQLEMWAEARSQDFAGHSVDFGFYFKYIRKAFEDLKKKSDMTTRLHDLLIILSK